MTFHIITIFPEIFNSYFHESIVGRAIKDKKISVKIYNLRDYTEDKHKKVDDTPFGGGPGMVMQVEPVYNCVEEIKKSLKSEQIKTVLFSAKGEKYSQAKAFGYSELDEMILICGRYEGVDERVAEHIADEEVSIGDYVLTGGEIPAMAVVDSVARLIPGTLGNRESLSEESFNLNKNKKYDYPVYTRPENFKGWKVPKVLLSGDHKKVEKWRKSKQK